MGKKVCRYLAAGGGVESSPMRNQMVPGSAPALRSVGSTSRWPSGAPRARDVENTTGLRPHFFERSPRGRVLVHPRAGAIPETMALSRLWRGDRLQRRFTWPVEFVVPLEIRGSIFTTWPSVWGKLIQFPSGSECLNLKKRPHIILSENCAHAGRWPAKADSREG